MSAFTVASQPQWYNATYCAFRIVENTTLIYWTVAKWNAITENGYWWFYEDQKTAKLLHSLAKKLFDYHGKNKCHTYLLCKSLDLCHGRRSKKQRQLSPSILSTLRVCLNLCFFLTVSSDSPPEFRNSFSSCVLSLPACPDCSFLQLPGFSVLAKERHRLLCLPRGSVYLLQDSWCSLSLSCPSFFPKTSSCFCTLRAILIMAGSPNLYYVHLVSIPSPYSLYTN